MALPFSYQYSNVPPPAPPMENMVYEIAVPPRADSPPSNQYNQYVTYGGNYDDRGRDGRGGGLGRSSSTKNPGRGTHIQVGDSRRDRSRARSTYYGRDGYDDDRRGRKSYGGGNTYYATSDTYSVSSREQSRERRYGRRARSPSVFSDDFEYPPYPPGPGPGMAAPGWPGMGHHPGHHPHQVPPPPSIMMAPAPPAPPAPPGQALIQPGQIVPYMPQPAADDLALKIKELQLELAKSKEEADKIAKAKQEEEERKKKDEELRLAVQRQIEKDKQAEEERKAAAEAERRRVEEAARKLIEDQKAAAEAAAKAKAEDEARIRAAAIAYAAEEAKKKEDEQKKKEEAEAAIAEQLRQQQMMIDLRKPTHTKFSKTHLCKEALDERKISYTEQEDSFLVHRWVDREEQNALWARTKQIRAYQLDYQRRFKEEADKAPVIDTPNGPVKIVKVGNNPPVTVPVVLVTKKAPVVDDGKFSLFRR